VKQLKLVGQTFGDLLVVEFAGLNKYRQTIWKCTCRCGNTTTTTGGRLRGGRVRSCGCHKIFDYTGRTVGRLTVISRITSRSGKSGSQWLCYCACGTEVIKSAAYLHNALHPSCGCWGIEFRKERTTKHGKSGTREYSRARLRQYRDKKFLYDTQWTLEMESILRRLFPNCVICGMTNEKSHEIYGRSLCVDHVNPLSKGYGLQPGNAVILCTGCNVSKGDKELSALIDKFNVAVQHAAQHFECAWRTSGTEYLSPVYELYRGLV
jgi:5-methylcytosine-specific restriction endonuclease McrA